MICHRPKTGFPHHHNWIFEEVGVIKCEDEAPVCASVDEGEIAEYGHQVLLGTGKFMQPEIETLAGHWSTVSSGSPSKADERESPIVGKSWLPPTTGPRLR